MQTRRLSHSGGLGSQLQGGLEGVVAAFGGNGAGIGPASFTMNTAIANSAGPLPAGNYWATGGFSRETATAETPSLAYQHGQQLRQRCEDSSPVLSLGQAQLNVGMPLSLMEEPPPAWQAQDYNPQQSVLSPPGRHGPANVPSLLSGSAAGTTSSHLCQNGTTPLSLADQKNAAASALRGEWQRIFDYPPAPMALSSDLANAFVFGPLQPLVPASSGTGAASSSGSSGAGAPTPRPSSSAENQWSSAFLTTTSTTSDVVVGGGGALRNSGGTTRTSAQPGRTPAEVETSFQRSGTRGEKLAGRDAVGEKLGHLRYGGRGQQGTSAMEDVQRAPGAAGTSDMEDVHNWSRNSGSTTRTSAQPGRTPAEVETSFQRSGTRGEKLAGRDLGGEKLTGAAGTSDMEDVHNWSRQRAKKVPGTSSFAETGQETLTFLGCSSGWGRGAPDSALEPAVDAALHNDNARRTTAAGAAQRYKGGWRQEGSWRHKAANTDMEDVHNWQRWTERRQHTRLGDRVLATPDHKGGAGASCSSWTGGTAMGKRGGQTRDKGGRKRATLSEVSSSNRTAKGPKGPASPSDGAQHGVVTTPGAPSEGEAAAAAAGSPQGQAGTTAPSTGQSDRAKAGLALLHEIRENIRRSVARAPGNVGFDLEAVFGHDSKEPEKHVGKPEVEVVEEPGVEVAEPAEVSLSKREQVLVFQ